MNTAYYYVTLLKHCQLSFNTNMFRQLPLPSSAYMETSINTQLVIVISISTKISNKASGWHALPVDLRKA